MRRFPVLAVLTCLVSFGGFALSTEPTFKKIVVSDRYHGEGAYYGDFNKDGILDIVCGHFWYDGPDFAKKHRIYEGNDFDPKTYSNCFGVFSGDFNGDGWDDVLICPHPGATGYWYENPQNKDGLWKTHEATIELGNESQAFADIDGDGRPDLLFNRNNHLGFASFDPEKPDRPWTFIPVSEANGKFQKYTHGLGYGDLDGDGRIDILEKDGWRQQPARTTPSTASQTAPWRFHPYPFSEAAAHLLVTDIDGDGLNDVVTALHCHLYGLAWDKQVRKPGGTTPGEITFERNILIPREPATDFVPKVSQLHALALGDVNGDGVMDFVTGKRFWAHGPTGDVAPDDPALLIWWEVRRGGKDGNVEIVPHVIDDDSGAGTQVVVHDFNGDGRPDVLVGNKKGTFVFLRED